ncbi:sensor histidine kinase [Luteibaculum oceani]|uniref:histidine kinase n=1 Tax=Luteibaculum oceani TaxID=1294296 RepID=A0A5C6VAI6_9FLAO|nr:response regulator [Luteibaculum oceani]TXC81551.1 response regulator [Luteibaculum oceani]
MDELISEKKLVSGIAPKILAVDDKVQNLVALRRVLADFDVEIVEAQSGNEALKKILQHDFALALLDVQMPEMDGYELAEIIRSDPETHELPIIFISAIFTDRLNMFRGYEKGAFSFITKPFEPIELQNQVKFFIKKYLTERAYEESRSQTIQLYNSSPEMLLSIDANSGLVTQCNNRIIELTGYSREEIIDHSVFKFFRGTEDFEKARKEFAAFKDKEIIENVELTILTKDERKLEILWKAIAIKNNEGVVKGANSTWTDITEKNEMQRKLEASNKELELRNEELENFVYLTSHQLQEPTQSILSFMDLLNREYIDQIEGDGAEYIKYSLAAAGRMRDQVKELLDYLRLGELKECSDVDLDSIVHNTLNDLDVPTELDLAIHPLPVICGIEPYLKMLFRHLLSNSIKYRDQSRRLVLEVGGEVKGGCTEVFIRDNGIGIPENQLDKVFKIFQQLHARDKYPGLGVGMAVVKKIADLHKASIQLESKEGIGTTLTLRFPKS